MSAAGARKGAGFGGPVQRLLHALNQPLTGLQCALEVALAVERTPEQYADCLRQGLELTGRMRWLVEALREVAELQEVSGAGRTERMDMKAVLLELVEELRPVAEAAGVGMALRVPAGAGGDYRVRGQAALLRGQLMRTLDAAAALSHAGSELDVDLNAGRQAVELRVRWRVEEGAAEPDSRAEVSLVVAQAGLERGGAEWTRQTEGVADTVTVIFPGCEDSAK